MSESSVTPWWKALKIRREITTASGAIDDVQMSLFRAVYGTGSKQPKYAKASYYGDITHPTSQLVDLLAKIAIRLGGGPDYQKAPALTRLDQGMGGGKSHACIGAWHCAAHAADFAATDVGEAVFDHARDILGHDLPPDLNRPQVVVLPCDNNMTPGAPVQEHDGPAHNLYERFLWRLFEKDYNSYEEFQPYFNDKAKIGDALRTRGKPVLVIIDEIMDYVGNGLDAANKPELTAQDMGFLRAFLEAINDVPNAAALVVMIASEKDSLALSDEGSARRDELHQLLDRNGRQATVNENADFAAILRRRLFDSAPAPEVIAATASQYAPVLTDKGWKTKVYDMLNAPWTAQFAAEVQRTYPFHPQLMHLAEHEWANLSGFQKVRSTIRVFAATVYALQQRARSNEWVPALIGPGDLPLSDSTVRESILGSGLITDTKAQSNYRSIVQNDIVNLSDDGGTARMLDFTRRPGPSTEANPRATERAATAVFLASIVGSRGQGRRGASDPETKAAITTPTVAFGIADADGVIKDLTNPDTGLSSIDTIAGRGGQSPRYYLTTVQTLPMLARAARSTISDQDRDKVLADTAERLAVSGPFNKKIFVRANPKATPRDVLIAEGIDDARTTRLVVLDPSQFSLRNGKEAETLDALESVLGLGPNRIAVEWASSAVFVLANTQARQHARRLAIEYLAWDRVVDAPEAQSDETMRDKAMASRTDARRALEGAVKRAFQHVVYLAQPDPDSERYVAQSTIEGDENALDGHLVWKLLVDQQKAFETGQLTARALLHNLRDQDYGRPLAEIRDSFWSAPRLPLLRGGESDLRQALFDAVRAEQLRIINAANEEVAVTAVAEINLSSQGLRIARPAPATGTSDGASTDGADGTPDPGGGTSSETTNGTSGSSDTQEPPGNNQPKAEKLLSFTVMQSLINRPDQADALATVFRRLYDIVDRRAASHVQGTIKIALNADQADALAQEAGRLGINMDLRDL